jgi:O-Antigen ligase
LTGARMAAAAAPAGTLYRGSAFTQKLLNLTLFVTIVTSAIAFIEPSPHDALMVLLLMVCAVARVRLDHKLAPLVIIITLWLCGAGMALIQLGDNNRSILYVATSVYLGVACIMFACLFSDGDMARLAILRRAYLIAALIATVAGYMGFFHIGPGSQLFLDNDRVSATFKDPNVYGPFLVFPLLMLVIGALTRRVTVGTLLAMAFLMGGLFLSFSRGAWIHFAISGLIAVALVYAATPDPLMRARIVMIGLCALVGVMLLVIAMSSIDSIREMLLVRARAIQPYDVGSGGRFSLQELALSAILDHPFGMGPIGFGLVYGGQQHNVYMQCFLVYGWLGGIMYAVLVLLTLVVGLRNVLVRAPWQGYLIAAFAAFVGEAFEGLIVDTDHWRHFFLVVGLVWGLSVASVNYRRAWAGNAAALTGAALVPAAS